MNFKIESIFVGLRAHQSEYAVRIHTQKLINSCAIDQPSVSSCGVTEFRRVATRHFVRSIGHVIISPQIPAINGQHEFHEISSHALFTLSWPLARCFSDSVIRRSSCACIFFISLSFRSLYRLWWWSEEACLLLGWVFCLKEKKTYTDVNVSAAVVQVA